MDRTLDLLTDRIDPKRAWKGVLDFFKSEGESGQSARKTGRSLTQPIRENPLAAIALGASAVCLIAGSGHDDDQNKEESEDFYDLRPDSFRQLPSHYRGKAKSSDS